jgi:outer membrane lipoprotein SlyB
MIVIAGALGGALWGGFLAKRRGGARADIAHYAAAFGVFGALAGLFATIAVERML